VSTPVSWDEVAELADGRAARDFAFSPAEVLERVDEHGDLYVDSITGDQELPELG
jgi:bifunctional non-homologous end joining protein LigD